MFGRLLFLCVCFYLAACSPLTKKPSTLKPHEMPLLQPVLFEAVAGDLHATMAQLSRLKENELSGSEKALKARYIERFVRLKAEFESSGNSLVDELHTAYIEYWFKVMLRDLDIEAGDRFLFDRLASLARKRNHDPGEFSLHALARLLLFFRDELKQAGFYSYFGRISPYQDFMAWRKQEERIYTVDLGDEVRRAPVILMDDFAVLGWGAFATFDIMLVGGWTRGEKLYCVKPAYDLESEDFKIGFLAHEARHLSDYRKFPRMSQTELEFRAKLTELHLADSSLVGVIDKLLGERKNEPALPHPYAAYLIVQELTARIGVAAPGLKNVSPDRIRKTAGLLLRRRCPARPAENMAAVCRR